MFEYFRTEKVSQSVKSSGLPPSANVQQSEASSEKESTPFLGNIQLYSIYRFQIPDGQFISRYIFLAQWLGDRKCTPALACCTDTATIQWLSVEAILQEAKQDTARQLMDRFWGYEIVQACQTLQQQHQAGNLASFSSPQIQEFNSNEVLKYLTRQPVSPSGQQRNSSASFSQMLHEAKFAEKDVIKIYCDYVQHCFPSAAMTYCSFYEYFTKIGFSQFDEASLRHIFR